MSTHTTSSSPATTFIIPPEMLTPMLQSLRRDTGSYFSLLPRDVVHSVLQPYVTNGQTYATPSLRWLGRATRNDMQLIASCPLALQPVSNNMSVCYERDTLVLHTQRGAISGLTRVTCHDACVKYTSDDDSALSRPRIPFSGLLLSHPRDARVFSADRLCVFATALTPFVDMAPAIIQSMTVRHADLPPPSPLFTLRPIAVCCHPFDSAIVLLYGTVRPHHYGVVTLDWHGTVTRHFSFVFSNTAVPTSLAMPTSLAVHPQNGEYCIRIAVLPANVYHNAEFNGIMCFSAHVNGAHERELEFSRTPDDLVWCQSLLVDNDGHYLLVETGRDSRGRLALLHPENAIFKPLWLTCNGDGSARSLDIRIGWVTHAHSRAAGGAAIHSCVVNARGEVCLLLYVSRGEREPVSLVRISPCIAA